MMLEYSVTDSQGNEHVVTPQMIEQQLSQGGLKPMGISADGANITVDQNGQAIEGGIEDLLKAQGFKVNSVRPNENMTDYGGVNKYWRAAIESLPNVGDVRKSYLTAQLQDEGVEDSQIRGSGSDFYYFNPDSQKWMALTNKPGLDWSDVAGQGANLASVLGNVAGGALGAGVGTAAGPGGTLAGAATGSALGGQAVRGGIQSPSKSF